MNNMPDARRSAAEARRDQVGQRADKPKERHSSTAADDRHAVVRAQLQVREAESDSTAHFTGLASAYEQAYDMYDFFGPYTEIVSAGAATSSLQRTDLDVPLVLQHDQLRRIARTTNGTLTLTETNAGLEVDAPKLDMDDVDVRYIVPKIRAGLITEMSFAFRITRGTWSPDYSQYRIEEFDIHRGDVAIVGFGANPYTGVGIRQRGADLITTADTALLPLR